MSSFDFSKYPKSLTDNQTLIFFIERLNELLFDYTISTFKPRALNTTLLSEELINIFEEVENGVLDAKNIEHIFEELKWSYKTDPIAKKIIGERRDDYLEKIDISDTNRLKTLISLLNNRISDFTYLDECKIVIKSLVKSNSVEKRRLEKTLGSFITGLIDLGYNKSFIYRIFKKHFGEVDDDDIELEFLDEFFDEFQYQNNEYTVIFKAHHFFRTFQDSCSSFNLEITDNIDSYVDFRELIGNQFLEKRDNQVYIVAKEVRELDGDSARIDVLRRIEKVSNLFIFFHHKKRPSWNSTAYVINKDTGESIKIAESTPVLHKTTDSPPAKADIELKRVLRNFRMEGSSFRKFDTAIDLHASAIKSHDLENQLLNLWIAIETLIPPNKSKSKIANCIDVMTNYLVYGYTDQIFRYVSRSIIRDSPDLKKEILNHVKGDLELHKKIAAIIVCEEYKEIREKFLEDIDHEPLLKYRIRRLNKEFSKGKEVKEFIETHKFKVRHQLQRIYRTRNLIVHSGRMPAFTEHLVENLHNYLDIFLKTTMDFVLDKRVGTIEQACLEVELLVNQHLKTIQEKKDDNITLDNIDSVIFGIK